MDKFKANVLNNSGISNTLDSQSKESNTYHLAKTVNNIKTQCP